MQRPPSICYGRIAMPAAVEGVPEEARHTPISPYISLYLPISPYISRCRGRARGGAPYPYISLYLHISPYVSLYLPISPYISLYLPISPAVEGVPEEARRTPCASG